MEETRRDGLLPYRLACPPLTQFVVGSRPGWIMPNAKVKLVITPPCLARRRWGRSFMPQTYRKHRRIYAAQNAALSVCIEQYICVVYLERRVESLAVCMPHMDNKCANFYAKDLMLNAGRQRLRCAWALTVMPDCLKGRTDI